MIRTIAALESSFSRICTSTFPLEWDENHLTFLLMKELRQIFSNRIIKFQDWSKIVHWQSFKNRGKQESSYGDISLLVHVQFSSGELIKGVATIEAKRSYQAGNFESVDLSQLDRIVENTPFAHLLLYNHWPQELQLKWPNDQTWKSNLWISPVNTAKELLSQTTISDNIKVLRVCFPFSMFLTSRIFWGLDLDFRDDIYNDIVGGLKKLSNSSYLGVVNVFYEHQKPIEVNLSELWVDI